MDLDDHNDNQSGNGMSSFTPDQLAFLGEGRTVGGGGNLARIATVGQDGTPHIVPVGMWRHNPATDTIDVRGHDVDKTKRFRDVARSGRAAIVIDDLASVDPFRPRAVEVRGRAEAITDPEPLIRIHPERIVSWGTNPDQPIQRSARTVT